MFNWIRAHKTLMIIFAIILVLCIIISISYIKGDLGPLGNGIEVANNAVQKPVASVSGGIRRGIINLFSFREIAKENEELKDRINELEKEVIELKLSQHELDEMRELSNVLNYEAVANGKTPITANITASDASSYFNIFTIDRGSESGIEKDCIVVTGIGLAGRVIETGTGYSKVISIIDEASKVSFQVLRDMNIMGIVEGDGKGELVGYTLDSEAEIIEGDLLITSGLGIFPEGVEIGKVVAINFNQDTQLKNIEVETSVSFKNLKKVTVLI